MFCHEIAGMDRGRKVLDSKQSSLCYLPFDLCSQSVPGECSVDTLIYQEEAMVFFNLLLLLLFDDDGYNSLLLRSHLTLSVSGEHNGTTHKYSITVSCSREICLSSTLRSCRTSQRTKEGFGECVSI